MKTVLIANRGEIARRINKTLKKLGLKTIGIASEADLSLPYTKEVDKLVTLKGKTASETYLKTEKILEIEADAIHPGYGFLSENAEFAKSVEEQGKIFIGPKSESIRLLGSKPESRKLAQKLNIPITEGSKGGLSDEELLDSAKIFPVLIKASGGGGGRGMRIARNKEELKALIPQARSEAKKFFNNDDIYFEQYIEKPRHMEVQIFGDKQGNVIHLGTRECSIQRRYQKLIEEAPAIGIKREEEILRAAINLAKEVGYESAGTAEFLVDGENFYFLEVNTRLQVEHTVTEEITGLDLVELQIKVARGEPLPSKINFTGHSIEYRINAEDCDFVPSLGEITSLNQPTARFDCGYAVGTEISQYYDNLIGKLIVTGASREEVVKKSLKELASLQIKGVETTVPLYLWLILRTKWSESQQDLRFLDEINQKELKLLSNLESGELEIVFSEGETLVFKEPWGTFLAVKGKEKAVRSLSKDAALSGLEKLCKQPIVLG